MRTTQKNIAKMLRELRMAIGAKTNKQAKDHVYKAEQYFEKKLGPLGYASVNLSFYMDNSWTLSALPPKKTSESVGTCTWSVLYLSLEEWMDAPSQVVKKLLSYNNQTQ